MTQVSTHTLLPDSPNLVGGTYLLDPSVPIHSPYTPFQFFLSSWSLWVSPDPWLPLTQVHPRGGEERKGRVGLS